MTLGLSVPPDTLSGAPTQQLQALGAIGLPGHDQAISPADAGIQIADSDLVIDALFGYRLDGPQRPPNADFIQMVNARWTPCLSLDGAAGLSLDSGEVLPPMIQAWATLTLAWDKRVLFVPAAGSFAGAVWLADIGIPSSAYRAVGLECGALFRCGPIVRVMPMNDGWQTIQAIGPALT